MQLKSAGDLEIEEPPLFQIREAILSSITMKMVVNDKMLKMGLILELLFQLSPRKRKKPACRCTLAESTCHLDNLHWTVHDSERTNVGSGQAWFTTAHSPSYCCCWRRIYLNRSGLASTVASEQEDDWVDSPRIWPGLSARNPGGI